MGDVVPFSNPKCPGKDKVHSRDKRTPPAKAAAPKKAAKPSTTPTAGAPHAGGDPAGDNANGGEDDGPLTRCQPRKEFRKLTSYVDAVLANQVADATIEQTDSVAPMPEPVISDQEAGLLTSIAAVETLPTAAPEALAALQAQLAKLRMEQSKLVATPMGD